VRVLLTGASGYVGRSVAAALSARDDEVVPVTHRPPLPGQVGIDLEAGRLDASRLPGGELGRVDAAIHLAGTPIIGRWTSRRRELIRSSRVAVGDLVARALASLPERPAVYVSGSAIGYYGERGEEELDESSGPGTGFLADLCRAWEAATAHARTAGIRVVTVRTGLVLGQGGGTLGAMLPIFRAGLGGNLGSGRHWMSWVSLADEVEAILFAVDTPSLSGPVNSVSPFPVRNEEFTAALAAAVHRRARLSVPAVALEAALGRGPAREMVLASQKVRPSRLEEAGFVFRHPELGGALRAALGLHPPTSDPPPAAGQ